MDIQVKNLVIEWCKSTQERLLKNLEKRTLIGQRDLVSAISYQIHDSQDDVLIEFKFERQRQSVFKKTNTIFDPLFRKEKPFRKKASDTAFTAKANIFELLPNKYFSELFTQVAQVNLETAMKLRLRFD